MESICAKSAGRRSIVRDPRSPENRASRAEAVREALQQTTKKRRKAIKRASEAMGGKLEIIGRFPKQSVRITQFEALDQEGQPSS